MLFSYTYVSHPLEKLHYWISGIVLDVWCRKSGKYSIRLLCPELQEIADHIDTIETNKRSIFDDIRDIDGLIQPLPQPKRDELAKMFKESTAVEELCRGSTNHHPFSFQDLKTWDAQIAEKLKTFFYDLFDKHIQSGPIKKKLGDLKNHVDSFCDRNSEGICPFCGLEEMRGKNYHTRDDYDHYLPRHKYPFNSINFRNLAPMCSTCNKSYKGKKDPISRSLDNRQKAYTPFDQAVKFPVFSVNILNPSKIQTLAPEDISIEINSTTHREEINTWQWLFGIQERYKGKLCKKRGAYAWLNNVLEAKSTQDLSPKTVLQIIRENTASDPFYDDGYLKLATLEACEAAGLMGSISTKFMPESNRVQ